MGAEASGHDLDYDICNECHEHCAFVDEEGNEIENDNHRCPLCDGTAF